MATFLLLFLLLGSTAFASSPSFGVSVASAVGRTTVVSAQGFVPVLSFVDGNGPVQISARADVSMRVDFATLPSVGLAAEAVIGPVDEAHAYVTSGIVAGARTIDEARAWFAAWSLVAGVRIPVGDTFSTRIEVVTTPQLAGMALSIGLDVAPWR